jgi:hypothetical protein
MNFDSRRANHQFKAISFHPFRTYPKVNAAFIYSISVYSIKFLLTYELIFFLAVHLPLGV